MTNISQYPFLIDSSLTFPGGPGHGIMVVDNAIPHDLCEKMLLFSMDAVDSEIGMDGLVEGGLDPSVKRTRDVRLSNFNNWPGSWAPEELLKVGYDIVEMDRQFSVCVSNAIAQYVQPYLGIQNFLLEDSGYQIQKYRRGVGFYKPHIDGMPGSPMAGNRLVAFLAYLNTVEHGGETDFPLHGLRVPPVQGRVVMFPASWTHPHEALMPLSDDKYVVSTFISAKMNP